MKAVDGFNNMLLMAERISDVNKGRKQLNEAWGDRKTEKYGK